MKLRALRLHNVRRFAGRGVAIEEIGDGVNVLCAANEFGKSTCFDALHALFFQPHSGTPGAVQALRPYSSGNPLIEVDVEVDGRRLRIAKQYYGGRRAAVTDLGSGRLLAQADEAERMITDLVQGGAGGPAGLLWVRQGVTGLERRTRGDEEGEKRAREVVLSSVQGEVEALTGGRRMAEVLAACEEELARYVTASGKPKAGQVYAAAVDAHAQLAAEEQRLAIEIADLQKALDARRSMRERLAGLERPEEEKRLRRDLADAESAHEAAKAHKVELERAEAEATLDRNRHIAARVALQAWHTLLTRTNEALIRYEASQERSSQAQERRGRAADTAEAAEHAAEAAEATERAAQELSMRLARAARTREAFGRLKVLKQTISRADAARVEIEEGEMQMRLLVLPDKGVEALQAIEVEIAGLKAAATAHAPRLRIDYAPGIAGALATDRGPLADGEERTFEAVARVSIAGIGTLTLSPGRREGVDALPALQEQRRRLLERLGVANLAEARQRAASAKERKAGLDLARQSLKLLAPDGIDVLREEAARLACHDVTELELKGDPDEATRAHDAARRQLDVRRNEVRAARPARDEADRAVIEAEKEFAAAAGAREAAEAELGPPGSRALREAALADELAEAEGPSAASAERVARLRAAAPDLGNVEAALERIRSIVQAAEKTRGQLREQLADLNGRIHARAEGAVEERWREACEAKAAAEAGVARIAREVAALTRLRGALADARSAARDHYFEPVLRELRPLLGLLFEEAHVAFDEDTLLPRTVQRNGLVEEIERLSGGMREQLSVLTRLAFARLLASDGRPAPVILDDALVYSDDDRIERMFTALHRQSRDQQIIVFSCRQRAFSRLGGNVLTATDWLPAST